MLCLGCRTNQILHFDSQCTHHWQEEVELLFEEMKQTLLFLERHAKWWTERVSAMATTDEALSEGCHAYAKHQAELQQQIRGSFAHMWRDMQRLLDVANANNVSLPSVTDRFSFSYLICD